MFVSLSKGAIEINILLSFLITKTKCVEILVGFCWKLFEINKFLYFDDAHYDMENRFFALAPKCSGNVDEDKLIFKSYYIYDILAPKFDPQGGGVHTNPPGHPIYIAKKIF